jgi:hypothetical protein
MEKPPYSQPEAAQAADAPSQTPQQIHSTHLTQQRFSQHKQHPWMLYKQLPTRKQQRVQHMLWQQGKNPTPPAGAAAAVQDSTSTSKTSSSRSLRNRGNSS